MDKEVFDKMFDTKLSKRMNVYLNQNRNKNGGRWMIASSDKSQRPSASIIEDYEKAKIIYSIKVDNDTIWQMQQLLAGDARTPTIRCIIKWFKEAYNITSEVILVDQDRVCFEDCLYGLYQSHRKTAIVYYLATNFDSFELTEQEQEVIAKEKHKQKVQRLYETLVLPSVKDILDPVGFNDKYDDIDSSHRRFRATMCSYEDSMLKEYFMKSVNTMISDKLKTLGFKDYDLKLSGEIWLDLNLDPNNNLESKLTLQEK